MLAPVPRSRRRRPRHSGTERGVARRAAGCSDSCSTSTKPAGSPPFVEHVRRAGSRCRSRRDRRGSPRVALAVEVDSTSRGGNIALALRGLRGHQAAAGIYVELVSSTSLRRSFAEMPSHRALRVGQPRRRAPRGRAHRLRQLSRARTAAASACRARGATSSSRSTRDARSSAGFGLALLVVEASALVRLPRHGGGRLRARALGLSELAARSLAEDYLDAYSPFPVIAAEARPAGRSFSSRASPAILVKRSSSGTDAHRRCSEAEARSAVCGS